MRRREQRTGKNVVALRRAILLYSHGSLAKSIYSSETKNIPQYHRIRAELIVGAFAFCS